MIVTTWYTKLLSVTAYSLSLYAWR